MGVGAAFRLAALLILTVLAVSSQSLAKDGAGNDNVPSVRRLPAVRDAIEMSQFVYPEVTESDEMFSPDGKHFIVVIRKGNIDENTNEYDLLLFDVDGVPKGKAARKLLSMASSSNRPGLESPRWLSNRAVAFLGERLGQSHQVYVVDVISGELTELSYCKTDVIEYEVAEDGRSLYFLTAPGSLPMVNADSKRHGIIVTSQWLPDLISLQEGLTRRNHHDLYKLDMVSRESRLVNPVVTYSWPAIWPSPNGRYVVVAALFSGVIPDEWKEYQTREMRSAVIADTDPGDQSLEIVQLQLIDTVAGTVRPLTSTPVDRRPQVVWSTDGQHVFVAGGYLPLNVADPEEREIRARTKYLVEVEVQSSSAISIGPETCARLVRMAVGEKLVCYPQLSSAKGDTTPAISIWSKANGTWRKAEGLMNLRRAARPFDVQVDEDMNTPPRLMAYYRAKAKKVLLLDPNPQFHELRFGHVESINVPTKSGQIAKAGIYYPPAYDPGTRYPLIIQTHGWNPTKFWINGASTTAFAAQALAARGFIVMQIQDINSALMGSPAEILSGVDVYEGAIDLLDREGMIDRNRVGIIGFSRTGLYVERLLTHSNYPIAAASLADVSDAGYFRYVGMLNVPGFAEESEGDNGTAPFGEGLRDWLNRSPDFNLDKVTAPVMLEVNDNVLVFVWEWFAGLRHLHKPVEFIYIPEGAHQLVKPWERIVSQQGTVDWFQFWLRDSEDPDPSKAEQYERWRKLKGHHGVFASSEAN